MELINRFRECREKTPYNQKQVALMIGVKPPQISKWEKGEGISRQNCIKLAKLYNVSADYLLGLSDDPTPGTDTQKEPATAGGLDSQLVEILITLSPDQVQRVKDFVAGMKASEKA